jgi:hypothetical protein
MSFDADLDLAKFTDLSRIPIPNALISLPGPTEWTAALPVWRIRIPDPVPFLPLDPGSGTGKKKSRSGSWRNIPDDSLETIFRVKILKFFEADPGWVKIRIRDKHPGSATLTAPPKLA